jgi:hypothetical protein
MAERFTHHERALLNSVPLRYSYKRWGTLDSRDATELPLDLARSRGTFKALSSKKRYQMDADSGMSDIAFAIVLALIGAAIVIITGEVALRMAGQ